ncbi:peroxisomal acyl-coenzyme A oxidase 1-like [Branchiostoma floridae x Branchiostoma japonicum]
MSSAKRTKTNPDLQKERDGASFNPFSLTCLLHGGEDNVERKRELERLALDDPELQHEHLSFLSREERYTLGIKKTIRFINNCWELDINGIKDVNIYKTAVFRGMLEPLSVHYGMFLPTLLSQGTEAQQDKWFSQALNYAIIGTYAQTEMGHGTFLRGLETTATYDPKTEEFVLHSPTLSSAKWWPGGLGKSSNHALVLAQLYTQGQCYGMHPFIVQLRSTEDHTPLPGITIGDIGPKFGFDEVDNGFLMMDHVRIPRENMLMKHSQVLPDGTYVKPANSKLAYGTMMLVRSYIVSDAAQSLCRACTIAVRYSCVRRQSEMKPGEPEPQVLDYQTQQYKLFPLLSAAYAFYFASHYMMDTYFQLSGNISQGDLSQLPEIHALSAGLKAFTTQVMSSGIDTCRMACGGHGYSHASGLPLLFANATAGCTYEGENTVMFLQTARYLVKCYGASKTNEKLSGTVAYLSRVQTAAVAGKGARNLLNLEELVGAYQHRAARLVGMAANQLQAQAKAGKSPEDAWNSCSVQLVKCAQAHCHFFMVRNFVDAVRTADVDSATRAVLNTLCQLYAIHGIIEHSGDFLEDSYLSGQELQQVNSHLVSLLAKVRPDAVALVDAFDFPDEILQSVLGRYDGNVYENLYDWAKKSPLNKSQVHESYHKYLKPFLQQNKAKL